MFSLQKRRSKDLPANLSDLIKKLNQAEASFIEMVDRDEPRMRDILEELLKLSEKVNKMQRRTEKARKGALAGAILACVAAPFTEGLSLIGAVAAGSVVVGSNLVKIWREKAKAEEVKKQGEEFMQIAEPLREKLEEIKTICDEMEQESSDIPAIRTLREVKLEFLLQQVKKLQEKSEGVLDSSVSLIDAMYMLVSLITPTPEADAKLRKSIISAVEQSQKVTDEFGTMRSELTKQ